MVVSDGQAQSGTSSAPVCDVVFVVEAAAALCGYFDSIKTNYILPTLVHFNGGPPDKIDYGCDYSCTMYSLVLYRSGDSAPEPASSCIRPTTSIHKFSNSLDQIRFYGGAGEAYSHMSEGLSTALQVFDDLNQIRGPHVSTEKHCILVCNSPAYQLPSHESINYAGLLPDQLVHKLTEKDVNLSVMAPRKMPALMRLFDKAHPDTPSSQMRNFTVDSRHLVLLKSFSLQERPQSPSLAKKDEGVSDGKVTTTTANTASSQQPSPAGVTVSRVGTSAGMNRPIATAAQSTPSNVPTSQNAAAAEAQKILDKVTAMSGAGGSVRPVQPGAATQNMNMMPGAHPNQPQQNFPRPPNMNQMPQQGMPMGQPGQFNTTNPAMQTQQPGVMPGAESNPGQGLPGVDINNPGPTLADAARQQQMQQKRSIWTGELEWTDKTKPDQPNAGLAGMKISRSLPCNISIAPSDPEVNAHNWPKKIIMQLIPQQLLSPLSSLFKASRKVFFTFANTDKEALTSLYRVMMSGFAGYVHFPGITQTEVKILMLLFSNRQRQFMGLIPNDQTRFIQGIKTIISKHKAMQTKNQPGGAAGGMPQVPNQVPGGMGSGMGTTMANTSNTTLTNMLGGAPQMGAMSGGQVQVSQPDMSGGGAFDMGGNMVAGGATGMQQPMMTPGQQQQMFARQQQQQQQQQQQLMAQRQQLQQQQQQQQRMQLQLQQQQQQQMGQQQLRHLLVNQQQQQQQLRQQMMMQQQRGARPVGPPQTGMMPGPQGMPQQQGQPFMGNENFDLPDLGI